MRVVSISTDRKIFDTESAVRQRTLVQGQYFDELHIIVYTTKAHGFEPWRIADNVWIYSTNSSSRFSYASDAVKLAATLHKLRKFTAKETVVTCQDPFETGWAGRRIKNKLGLPLQIQIHTDFLSPYFKRESFLNKIRVYLARKTLVVADEIRVVSERIKRSLSQLNIDEKKIDVLPIIVDAQKYEKPPELDLLSRYSGFTCIILMASRLSHEKNIGSALRIFKKIMDQYPHTGLVVVGEGPEQNNLKQEAEKLGIARSVIFEPWQKDLHSYYKTSQIFLVTSLYEGYGLTLVEAGLSGAAIVTSDVGIAGDILKDNHNSFVCPVNDEQAFVDKTTELIRNNALRQTFKTRIAEEMPHAIIQDTDTYMKQYRNLLEKTLKKNI